ncbi:MAG: hypothetical protein JWO03_2465 [Bacteroidetes bacterium]|nr:hypothetical protein [Bacteroidota bacterium]
MKKFLSVLAVAAIVFGTSSCSKSYTCACYNNSTGAASTTSVKATSTTDAAVKCSQQTQGGTSSCTLQ